MSGNTLYGNTLNGGSSGNGTVFRINTDGSGFTTIYSGIARTGSLVLSGSTLYWKAFSRAVFAVNTDGAGFTTLYSGTAGFGLMGLVLSGNTAYGTTTLGGSSGHGTIFSFILPPQLTLNPFRPQCDFEVDDQRYRVHAAIQHGPWFSGGLDHQYSGCSRRQRPERSDQSHLRHTHVLPLEPIAASTRDDPPGSDAG